MLHELALSRQVKGSGCRYLCRIFSLLQIPSSNHPATPESYTLSLHDALPISLLDGGAELDPDRVAVRVAQMGDADRNRSEEHTSELQSRFDLVCRLLLEKKKVHFDTHLIGEGQRRRNVSPIVISPERTTLELN